VFWLPDFFFETFTAREAHAVIDIINNKKKGLKNNRLYPKTAKKPKAKRV